MPKACPNCNTPMVLENAHGVLLNVCPACAGIWLTSDELHTLITCEPHDIEVLEGSLQGHIDQQHVGASKLLCPTDQTLLDEYHYLYNSPVLIHTCSKCGGLYIHGEDLPLMRQWFMKSHEPLSRKEEERVEMATDISEHEGHMIRQQHLRGMFNTLQRYSPGWFGFFP